jgi:N-acetylglucosamine-6-sulfatase
MTKQIHSHPVILILALAVFTILFIGASPACSAKSKQTDKPNIIIILTDDQPIPTLQYMPNLQKEIIAKGISFSNTYVTTPLCCPSRSSILTGLYVHNHGVLTNRAPLGGAVAFKDASTLPVWLQSVGYRTSLIGKYLNNYDTLPEGYIPPGWDDWHVYVSKDPDKDFYYGYTFNDNGKVTQYGDEPEDYSTDMMSKKAMDFIKQTDGPFFLLLSFYAPHQPYISADRHKDLYKTYAEFERYRPENFLEKDVSDKPAWVQEIDPQNAGRDPVYIDKVYQRILRTLMAVDDSVGQVTAALDDEGIRDNTLIIYMSDNGMALGDNSIFGKACPYDICIHVPFVISYPDKITASRVDPNLILNIDIAPTLADLAGIPNISRFDGQSFLKLLSDPTSAWRDGFLIEQYQDAEEEGGMTALVPSYVGFRTKEWKYVEYETGERELYNLINDPFELDNLAAQSQYEQTMQDLSARAHAIRP